MTKKRFYVYAIYVDGIVRYIGKGSNGRMHFHTIEARRINNRRALGANTDCTSTNFYRKLAEAMRHGATITEEIMVHGLTDREAYWLEKQKIEELHKQSRGQLWNTIDERLIGTTWEEYKRKQRCSPAKELTSSSSVSAGPPRSLFQIEPCLGSFGASAALAPGMLSHTRNLPTGFVAPCLPTKAPRPPTGALWLHEIKHNGLRVIARKDGKHVRLYSRRGNNLTYRLPLIVEALARLRSRSVIVDGEAVVCDDKGIPCFDRLSHRRCDDSVFLYAFDLIERNGDDLRRNPLELRKATLASLLAKAAPGLRLNEHIEADGPTVFAHACKMGLEGIVSKRKGSTYRSGRSRDWLKSKNPACEAVKREAEEDQ